MPQIVDIGNGQSIEFPDGMSTDQISSAVKNHLSGSTTPPVAPNPDEGLPQNISLGQKYLRAAKIAGSDIASIPGKIGGKITDYMNEAPTEIGGAISQFGGTADDERPSRAGLNLLKMAYNGVKGVINAPDSAENYAAHLGLMTPEQARVMSNPIESLPGESYLDSLLGKKQPGDALLQNLPLAYYGSKGALEGGKKVLGISGFQKAAGDVTLPLKEADFDHAQEQVALAESRHKQADEERKDAIESAKERIETTSVPTIKRKINESQAQLDQLHQETNAHTHMMDNLTQQTKPPERPAPPEPTTPPTLNQEPLENMAHAQGRRIAAGENLDNLIAHHDEVKSLDRDLDAKLGDTLSTGAPHDEEIASRIKAIEGANRKEISTSYDQLEENMKGKKVDLGIKEQLDDANKDLLGLVSQNKIPEANDLVKKIHGLENTENPSASDYLAMYRSARDYATDAAKKSYQPGMDAVQRKEWEQTHQELNDKVADMGRKLEDALGAEDSATLKAANKRWREEVAPLHRNATFQQIKNRTRTSDNFIKSIRGSDKGDVILRKIAKTDPAIITHAIGQHFDANPKRVLNAKGRIRDYIKLHPELPDLIQQKRQVADVLEKAKDNISTAKEAHKDALADERQAIRDANKNNEAHAKALSAHQKEFEKTLTAQEKAHQAALKNHSVEAQNIEKQRADLQKTMNNHFARIRDHEEYIKSLEKELPALEKAYTKANQTLKQKNAAAINLQKKKSELQEARKNVRHMRFGLPLMLHYAKRLGVKGLLKYKMWGM